MTLIDNPDWKVVYSASGLNEANIVKGLLESNGIECVIDMSESVLSGLIPTELDAELPILVNKEDESIALKLINEKPED